MASRICVSTNTRALPFHLPSASSCACVWAQAGGRLFARQAAVLPPHPDTNQQAAQRACVCVVFVPSASATTRRS